MKLLFVFLMLLSACSPKSQSKLDEAWDAANNPVLMMAYENEFVSTFNDLPRSGQPDKMPWSDNYWPSYQGGISYRWYSNKSQQLSVREQSSTDRQFAGQLDDAEDLQKLRSEVFGYKPYTKEQLAAMRPRERFVVIAGLSPAEKYDIFSGRFDYPTVASERDRTLIMRTLRDDPSYTPGHKIHKWFGICHAWAPATILFEEPGRVDLKSPDGFDVPMAASDVKALLSHMIDTDPGQSRGSTFLAERCNNDISNTTISAIYGMIASLKIGDTEGLTAKIEELIDYENVDSETKIVLASYFYAFSPDPTYASSGYERFLGRFSNGASEYNRKIYRKLYNENLKNIEKAGSQDAINANAIVEGITKAVRKPACNDTNAGAFHLVLTNLVGIQKSSFVIDNTRDAEVWNQAVAYYESDVVAEFEGDAISADAAPGTVKEIQLRTRFRYTTEMAPAWEPFGDDKSLMSYHIFTGDTYEENGRRYKAFEYKIELDRDGRIIGGSWISQVRPDFLWGNGTYVFSKDFAPLEDIYYQALDNRQRN